MVVARRGIAARLLLGVASAHALRAAGPGRRLVVSRVLLGLTVPLAPRSAPALQTATVDVVRLASARDKALELLSTLPTLAKEDGPIYVTQFAALNLKPASAALVALAPQLDPKAAGALAAELGERCAKISTAGRERELGRAEAEAKGYVAALDAALALAAVVYALPPPRGKAADTFSVASYFGPFACEGIPGLKRKANSNECVDVEPSE